VKNPGFARLALHEKCGVNNSSPAASISFRTGQTTARKALLRQAADAVSHRLTCWVELTLVPFGGKCDARAEAHFAPHTRSCRSRAPSTLR
jgi:hypothetical protein